MNLMEFINANRDKFISPPSYAHGNGMGIVQPPQPPPQHKFYEMAINKVDYSNLINKIDEFKYSYIELCDRPKIFVGTRDYFMVDSEFLDLDWSNPINLKEILQIKDGSLYFLYQIYLICNYLTNDIECIRIRMCKIDDEDISGDYRLLVSRKWRKPKLEKLFLYTKDH